MGGSLCKAPPVLITALDHKVEKSLTTMSESRIMENLNNFEKFYPFYRLALKPYLGRIKQFVLPEQDGNVRLS